MPSQVQRCQSLTIISCHQMYTSEKEEEGNSNLGTETTTRWQDNYHLCCCCSCRSRGRQNRTRRRTSRTTYCKWQFGHTRLWKGSRQEKQIHQKEQDQD